MVKSKKLKEVEVKSRADLRAWLSANHRSTDSIWLVIYKKLVADSHVPYAEIVEEALCFGWIDSRPNRLDQYRYKLLLSPRKKGSPWSAANKQRITKLVRSGRMKLPGFAKVKEAKRDGSWSALDVSDRMQIPPDLEKVLSKNVKASAFWETMAPSSKRGILEWIYAARRKETREARVKKTVNLAAKGLRANHYLDLKKLKKGPK